MGKGNAAMLRPTAVAGSWYTGHPAALTREVDEYPGRASCPTCPDDQVRAVLAPHAGLMYRVRSPAPPTPRCAAGSYDAVVLVGPSHYVDFEGVAVWPGGAFATPFGPLPVPQAEVERLVASSPVVSVRTDAHSHEHSLEMQLPFIAHLLPGVPIVPLVMGHQSRQTVEALAASLVEHFRGRRVLLVASSDLSHFFDAETADTLDGRVERLVGAFDADGLMREMERYPYYERGRCVMCGGGPAVAVMHAARGLGAIGATVLARSHSGIVSGDNDRVVGYLAAAFGEFSHP